MCSSIQNDTLGCNAVTWGPFSSLGSLQEDGSSTQRLATGSCDNMVRMYKLQNGKWEEEAKESSPHIGKYPCDLLAYKTSRYVDIFFSCSLFTLHNFTADWVRDVSWAPNTGMPCNTLASCSEDRTVYIWKQTESGGVWSPSLMHTFEAPVWRLSWSVTGNVLAVSTGDHMVTLWKQSVDETWVQITSVDDSSNAM